MSFGAFKLIARVLVVRLQHEVLVGVLVVLCLYSW